ncbi:hypothetical protein SUGI_1167230 [Cryptomeria japonica]|nr:hypothetical protein SUGI_1167230 [Cryptomeria japonica]
MNSVCRVPILEMEETNEQLDKRTLFETLDHVWLDKVIQSQPVMEAIDAEKFDGAETFLTLPLDILMNLWIMMWVFLRPGNMMQTFTIEMVECALEALPEEYLTLLDVEKGIEKIHGELKTVPLSVKHKHEVPGCCEYTSEYICVKLCDDLHKEESATANNSGKADLNAVNEQP